MVEDSGSQDAVVIERVVDAPAALVWRMWTESEHFAAWYAPTGVAVPVARMEVRVGGTRLVCMEMETPDGTMQMWFTGEYRVVVENKRLVYTESISDENGNLLPPSETGTPTGHPTTTEVTVDLYALGDRTRMVLTHVGVPANSPGAAGWNMALDKLAEYLAAAQAR